MHGHADALRRSLGGRSARHAALFLTSRAVNGALALLHLVLVTTALGPTEGGRFFLLWTAAWLLAAVLRFGTDGILPRAVAEAGAASLRTVSVAPVLAIGLLAGLAVLPVVLLALDVPLGALEMGLGLGLALSCAGVWVIASLLRAHGRADLSGLAANVFWPLGSVLAPLPLLGPGGTWTGLAALTLVAWILALVVSAAVAVRVLGADRLVALFGGGQLRVPVARDELGAATLTVLYEILGWLPVILAALIALGPVAAAGVFAATRIAGLFSWPYQSIIAVLVPRIAGGFARGDRAVVRTTLIRGAIFGALVTWPLCLAGILLAGPMLSVLDPRYQGFADVLVLLIAARAVDAATGPVGEALLVGRRTWLDVRIVLIGVATGTATAFALQGAIGDLAVGVGSGGAFVSINVLRALVLRRVLSRAAGPRPAQGPSVRPCAHP